MRPEKTTELLKHVFSEKEMAEKAQVLAQSYQRLAGAKEEKAAATATFGERIKREEQVLGSTSREMAQGWEMRQIPCKIRYNTPNTGIKSIIRIDTEEVVKTLSMDNDELQDTLFQDPNASDNPEKAIESNIRNFFGMTPTDENNPPPDDPLEIQAWQAGSWVVAAASAEFAAMWMEGKGHKHDEEFKWLDPETVLQVPASFYGADSMTARQAIAFLEGEEIGFPMLLQIPAGYLEELHKGKNPAETTTEEPAGDAGSAQDEAKPAADGKTSTGKPRKPRGPRKPKETPPETPATAETAETTDEGDEEDEDEEDGAGEDNLEPNA